ncbi:cyclin-like protein [Aulographum hederae CBS 113979]|uniref:RNA polymerase II holoenzyme cyclin-like subunit n=1 Tax=Aulographum hederae CBS 113979 TaxID=1176131 RepID=A0A6G1GVD2_9PEZI|nr:cyclin-like protein [Aulographum hederae CBS 113979]
MSASWWDSTQRKFWTLSKQELSEALKKLEYDDRQLVQQYPLPEKRLLNIFFSTQIQKLGRRVTVRQQALATAQVYLKRYYTRVEIRQTNPYLVLATAFYLACKMEECPQHIRLIVAEGRQTWPDLFHADISALGETEFHLISTLNAQLILHHPYRSLLDLTTSTQNPNAQSHANPHNTNNTPSSSQNNPQSNPSAAAPTPFPLTPEETSLAWSTINDHYLTDLPLLHAPHVIAITAVFLAVALKPSSTTSQNYGSGGAAGGQAHAAAMQGALINAGMGRGGGGGGGGYFSNAGGLTPGGGSAAGAGATAPGPQSRLAKLVTWLAESSIAVDEVVECVQELVSLWEVWERFNEKVCKEQIARFVKGRGLDGV